MLAIPTAFDLVATVLMNVGLLSVTASVYQMMRGAEMLFAALFAVVFLRRTLNRFHILGILCCVVRTASETSASKPEHHMLGSLHSHDRACLAMYQQQQCHYISGSFDMLIETCCAG